MLNCTLTCMYLTGLYRLYMYIISFLQSYPQCIIAQTVNNASPLHIYMYVMKLITNLLGCCLWWFLLLFCCFFAWFGDSLYRKQKKQQQFSNVHKKEYTKLKKYRYKHTLWNVHSMADKVPLASRGLYLLITSSMPKNLSFLGISTCIHHDCLKHRQRTVVQLLTLVNGFFCSGFPPCCKERKDSNNLYHDLKGSVSRIWSKSKQWEFAPNWAERKKTAQNIQRRYLYK